MLASRFRNTTCPMCGEAGARSPHHIVPQLEGGLEEPGNVVYLCKKCHNEVEEDPHLWARFLRSYCSDRLRVFRRSRRKALRLGRQRSGRLNGMSTSEIIMTELGIGKALVPMVIGNLAEAMRVRSKTVESLVRKRYKGHTSYGIQELSTLLDSIASNLGKRRIIHEGHF